MVDYFVGNDVIFRKGDKNEIIREVNIRFASFGGNVPTDEFTERTKNMIKKFQRDYMKDEYFAKSVEQVNGISMQTLITNKG